MWNENEELMKEYRKLLNYQVERQIQEAIQLLEGEGYIVIKAEDETRDVN